MYLVDVVLPLPLYQSFFYLSEKYIIPGIRVLVPFKNYKLIGIVKDCLEVTEKELSKEIEYKWIEETLDTEPLIPFNLFPLLEWVSQYYLTPLGLVYKIALPPGVFSLPQKRIYLTEKGKEAIKKGYLPEEFSLIKRKGYNLKYFLRKTGLTLRKINEFKEKEWIFVKSEFPKAKVPTEVFIRLKNEIELSEEDRKNIKKEIFAKRNKETFRKRDIRESRIP